MPHAYGWAHNDARRKLLADLARRGGAPCPRCGLWMDPRRPEALDVGHVVDVAAGGSDLGRRLEHSRCNRSAGAAAGNARRSPRAGARGAPRDDDEDDRPPLRVVGKGRGPEYEHDLNRVGGHLDPADWPSTWTVEVTP